MWREWKEESLTVQDLVLSHAFRVPVTTEADDHQPFLLAHNSLIDMPATDEMREDDGAHGGVWKAIMPIMPIMPIKVRVGVKEGSVRRASVRASKELFAEAELFV